MNIEKKKMASLVLFALLLLSFPAITTPLAEASPSYPPLPLVKLVITGNTAEVWLMGEGETNLDPYWDIMGLDIRLHFKPSAVQALTVKADPKGWFKAFWPLGIMVFAQTKDNVNGVARVAFVGWPGAGGVHTPPSGTGCVMNVTFNAAPAPGDTYLLNPMPRPAVPPWGSEYFLIDVAGFPHPERMEAPWNGNAWSPAIPHITVPKLFFPVVIIEASTRTPMINETVYLSASLSYDPDGTIVSYLWDLGNGTTVSGVTASVVYTEKEDDPATEEKEPRIGRGFYKVTLTVTDNHGLVSTGYAIMAVQVLRWAKPEHHVYNVYADEDEYNDLTVSVINFGLSAATVKVVFTTYDKRTKSMLGTLEVTRTVLTGDYTGITGGWKPSDYGWSGGRDQYEVIAELLLDDGTLAGTKKILFTVAP